MQRVVAGEFRGRRLLDLPSAVRGVRPSSSKIRSAIFDRLQFELRGARVLDPFAGTGALAIEALSRGAGSAVLFERQPALVAFLRRQVGELGLDSRVRVEEGDARTLLASESLARAEGFDLVLLDPPYADAELRETVTALLVENAWLAPDAVVVAETPVHPVASGARPWPGSLVIERVLRHGGTELHFLRLVKEDP